MTPLLRWGIIAVVVALVAWVSVGIYRAGGDVPPPPSNPQTTLKGGHAEGRKVDGKPSWYMDYDTITTTPDTTVATLENVQHGELFKNGKPFLRMKAKHVIVNTISNDFTIAGPVEFVENDSKHQRRFVSDAALYSGGLETLTLTRPSDVWSDGAHVKVASATVNFKSGDMQIGRILGFYK